MLKKRFSYFRIIITLYNGNKKETVLLNKEEELITLSEIALKNLPVLSGSAEFASKEILISFIGFG